MLGQFREAIPKQRVGEIDKNDLHIFAGWLRERGDSDRTIHNKIGDVVALLRANDIKEVTISYKFTEKKVKAYRESELKALFAACSDEEWITLQIFLGTGFREQEVSHAVYNDIDFEKKTITLRERQQLAFRPKDREERTVPIPDALLELLQAQREIRPENGVSARTIQEWLGHSDLNTTLRYLADAELGCSRTRQPVNSSFAIFKRDAGDD